MIPNIAIHPSAAEAVIPLEPAEVRKSRKRWADHIASDAVTVCAAAGDAAIAFLSLWIVFHTDLAVTARVDALFNRGGVYAVFGAMTLVSVISAGGIYSRRRLLHLRKVLSRLVRGGILWSLFYIGFITLVAGFSISTLKFAAATIGLGAAGLISWRLLLYRVISDESIASRLRQRILLIGWTPEAGRLSQSVWQYRTDPCEIVGYVDLGDSDATYGSPANIPFMGTIADLPRIFEQHDINVAWLADVNRNVGAIPQLTAQCEREMVEFKIIPSYFPILLSAIHVETVGGTPILGVDRLPLNFLHLRILKRLIDFAGGLLGMILTAPIIAAFCAIVYLESPGAVFYRQTRTGRKGKPFQILKIRSMRLDAEKAGRPGWTTKDDPRRLRIGAFMRKWNIDELPQFWNVMTGEMSLVGPRPERPELISNFKHEIEHYNARHTVKPGVTGWAQVNGLRGDTDLSDRIRHDIYYMEHWSLLFDLRIMFMTFFRHANAC
ncbi:MAG TPA: sugar transferase [Chthoniobacteraceae bacterium]|jgi:exopolysaccharide biosynthesis polyprenyl glycosylphosphotransferase|nr:sugar transferase [Chthoniobacteraceae bacterium]